VNLATAKGLKSNYFQYTTMKAERLHQDTLPVILHKEQGGYSVRCVELPGAISEGRTRKKALENIREAIQGYLEAFPEEAARLKAKNEIVQLAV
jgi:predicted RNase H-like HicB family nuclease